MVSLRKNCAVRAMVALGAAVLLGALGLPARAEPPGWVMVLEPGQGRFARLPPGGWQATSMNPEVVEAQAFETEELHLEPKAEGVALVLLTCPGIQGLEFWRIRVGGAPEPQRPDPAVLAGPCGCGAEGRWPLHCKVETVACLEALRTWLTATELAAVDLSLDLGVVALQALLKDLAQRIEQAGFRGIKLSFAAGNLRIEGEVADPAAWRRLMVVLYGGMVGRLVLEDRVKVLLEAGQKAP